MPKDDTRITRRGFGTTVGGLFAATVLEACVVSTKAPSSDGHLSARPGAGVATSLESGPLGLGGDRDGLIQVPAVLPRGAAPLLLFLHGATQNGAGMLRRIGAAADQAGIIVLAPDSRDTTWDAIRDGFGADVEYLNRALQYVFEHAAIDPARVVIGGFSDGASYAISLGLANGDLFSRVLAFSPGFVVSAPPHGHPHVFVSHGLSDRILPIDQCSRVIVPRLTSMGYDVTFREFDGRHEMPPAVVSEGLKWATTA
ncbi:MAG TPA: hypothetical protein VH583_14245 [Vicinamibacterales bacterium]|jgi:phospholipase/carboxylesterase